ncbi:Glycosyltransferase involved in cell wall bisynthesis [Oribacterium sp. KHPX15]|uniref:glycosyltransferase family 4 protein n=1 Tax=Oribacterium sp. KHPX15 TaxID=1855342 RepID=UPI000898E63B|nr:glycosyltransferase family 4 protein [Oribacterium sp. KHPX15]SEA81564.1 Glycosyltransferase involved in cell wall bisynthesis [Oribacterium sp. KHPX15]
MLRVKVVTSNIRGFLKTLFDYKFDNITFIYSDKKIYDIANKRRSLFAKLIHMKIFDYLGIFQVVKAKYNNEDIGVTYNRFLKTNKPYLILSENPSALVNYCWDRPNHYITKQRLKKLFRDNKLKNIICLSKTCFNSFGNLYGIEYTDKLKQIYPLVVDDLNYGNTEVRMKSYSDVLECLFISSDFYLKGGQDALKVFNTIYEKYPNIKLTIITKLEQIKEIDIAKYKNVTFLEFNLSRQELNEYYKKSAIFINPTRMDSSSLCTLEAMKYGCTLIATDMYAIREMLTNEYNGFMHKPLYDYWNDDFLPNTKDRKYKEYVLHSGVIDEDLVEWMIQKIIYLYINRNILYEYCRNSLIRARNEEFSEISVAKKWKKIIEESC